MYFVFVVLFYFDPNREKQAEGDDTCGEKKQIE